MLVVRTRLVFIGARAFQAGLRYPHFGHATSYTPKYLLFWVNCCGRDDHRWSPPARNRAFSPRSEVVRSVRRAGGFVQARPSYNWNSGQRQMFGDLSGAVVFGGLILMLPSKLDGI